MKIDGIKQFTVMILTLTIILAGALTVEAGHFGRNGEGGFIGLKTLMQLELSDTQKVAIGDLITKYRKQGENVRVEAQAARARLRSAISAEAFSEKNVRQAYQQMIPVMEERVVLRARFMAELKSVLNSDQLALLEERGAKRSEKMAERRRFRQAFMDTWLQMKSE